MTEHLTRREILAASPAVALTALGSATEPQLSPSPRSALPSHARRGRGAMLDELAG